MEHELLLFIDHLKYCHYTVVASVPSDLYTLDDHLPMQRARPLKQLQNLVAQFSLGTNLHEVAGLGQDHLLFSVGVEVLLLYLYAVSGNT